VLLQILHDVCPLRIDSVFVRDDDAAAEEEQVGGGCTLCISLLNSEQPVHLTEVEVVRIRKRSRYRLCFLCLACDCFVRYCILKMTCNLFWQGLDGDCHGVFFQW
jgi:hypothetical protein